jgi:TetR/AcrR family transcriptional repressor of mexJK operon
MGGSMAESTSLRPGAAAELQARRLPAETSRPDKRSAITRAASEMFLAEGFDRASLDQIAQRAGVSKQTIYSHFADKQALFKAISAELTETLTIQVKKSAQTGDLRSTLTLLGEDTLTMFLHPASLDLHRLIVSAASRFPELGRAAYEAGAERMMEDVATLLTQRSQVGDGLKQPVTGPQARVMAEQFIGMLRGFHQIRGLLGVKPVGAAERKAYVGACVEMILRAA